ncbi:hypothetical protein SAMN05421872_101492 [Nocardioides lianchengensis]|uniref:Uncharacterized protein n=1 Tax=Nocardioides lianchengensis TaxID=1045774 RepID=A0A1G6JIJ8_9ACTN|nr:hypothetical protein SAMN05421872_101492 [Nocardioides lianchengensis]
MTRPSGPCHAGVLDSRTRRPLGAVLLSAQFLALAAGGPLLATPPAAAHPFGPPLTAHLVPDDRRPTLLWHGAEDDWVALGEALGVFAEPDAERTGAELLTDSSDVRGYLAESVRLRQGDADCRSIADPGADVVENGMTITFDCPLPPSEDEQVELTLEPMIDLNPAYRTVLTVEGSDTKTLFTGDEPTQAVSVAGGGVATAAVALGGGTLVVAAGAGWFLLRRRRS